MSRRQPAGHPANSTKYRRMRADFLRRQGRWGECALCGESVDMSLSGRASMGPTIDHIVPTTAGGGFFDVNNWQLAHRRCNNAKGRGESIGRAGQSAEDRRFAPDGHWNDKPTGREPASPNGLECDNPKCRRCIAEGFHTEEAHR